MFNDRNLTKYIAFNISLVYFTASMLVNIASLTIRLIEFSKITNRLEKVNLKLLSPYISLHILKFH